MPAIDIEYEDIVWCVDWDEEKDVVDCVHLYHYESDAWTEAGPTFSKNIVDLLDQQFLYVLFEAAKKLHQETNHED